MVGWMMTKKVLRSLAGVGRQMTQKVQINLEGECGALGQRGG